MHGATARGAMRARDVLTDAFLLQLVASFQRGYPRDMVEMARAHQLLGGASSPESDREPQQTPVFVTRRLMSHYAEDSIDDADLSFKEDEEQELELSPDDVSDLDVARPRPPPVALQAEDSADEGVLPLVAVRNKNAAMWTRLWRYYTELPAFYAQRREMSYYYAMLEALRRRMLRVATFIYENDPFFRDKGRLSDLQKRGMVNSAVSSRRKEIVAWLLKRFPHFRQFGPVFGDPIAAHGQVDMLKYLESEFRVVLTTSAMDTAAAGGHADMVEYLHNNRYEGCTIAAMDQAAAHGHLNIVQFLQTNRTEGCSTEAMDRAASNGHLHVVEFLHTNRLEGATSLAITMAAANGHLRVLQFLHKNRREGCYYAAALEAAKRLGHCDVADYLRANKMTLR